MGLVKYLFLSGIKGYIIYCIFISFMVYVNLYTNLNKYNYTSIKYFI